MRRTTSNIEHPTSNSEGTAEDKDDNERKPLQEAGSGGKEPQVVRGTSMIGGTPALGEVYGFLHPGDEGAWLVLRNPSPEPRILSLSLAAVHGRAR